MADQDRSKWDRAAIAEGTQLLDGALRRGDPGPYQIQAAIAALHDEAPSEADTDWARYSPSTTSCSTSARARSLR